MSRRSALFALFATLATAAAVIFFALALDPDVYAPGARTLERHLPPAARYHSVARQMTPGEQRALFASTSLRKLYSVIAFGVVGFFAAPLLPRSLRLRADAALVGAFSLLIEIAQKLDGSQESHTSNLFDVLCGAAGGLLGAMAWNGLVRRPRERP